MAEELEPVIERIKIVVNTTKDDKDKEEEFIFIVFKDNDRYLDKREGKDKAWDNGDRQEFNYALAQSIPLSGIRKCTLRVEKTRYGSEQGCGWEGNIEVVGIPDKGVSKTLVPRTTDFKLGEKGNPHYKDFELSDK
jgi:hypothetical protein